MYQIQQKNDLVEAPLITFNSAHHIGNQVIEKRKEASTSSKAKTENNDKGVSTNEKNVGKTTSVKSKHQSSTKSSVTTPVSSDDGQHDPTTTKRSKMQSTASKEKAHSSTTTTTTTTTKSTHPSTSNSGTLLNH